MTITTPETGRLVKLASRVDPSHADLEGWGWVRATRETLTVGAEAWVYSYGRFRCGVVTKIGRTKAHVTFTTPGAIQEAAKVVDMAPGVVARLKARLAHPEERDRAYVERELERWEGYHRDGCEPKVTTKADDFDKVWIRPVPAAMTTQAEEELEGQDDAPAMPATCVAEAFSSAHVFDGRKLSQAERDDYERCGEPLGAERHQVEIQPGDFVRRVRVDTLGGVGPELEVVRVEEDQVRLFADTLDGHLLRDPERDGFRWDRVGAYRVVRRPEPVETPEWKAAVDAHQERLAGSQARVGTPMPGLPEALEVATRPIRELAASVRAAAERVWTAPLGRQCAESKAGMRCRLEEGHEGAHRTGDDVPASWEGREPVAVPCALGSECDIEHGEPGAGQDIVTFFVETKPRPKGSLRAIPYYRRGGGLDVRMEEQVSDGPLWRRRAAKAAQVAAFGPDATKIPPGFPVQGPVEVRAIFVFAPATDRKETTDPTDSGRYGDLDKLQRNLGDALQDAHVIKDDGQIVAWETRKRFAREGEPEGTYVTVWESV